MSIICWYIDSHKIYKSRLDIKWLLQYKSCSFLCVLLGVYSVTSGTAQEGDLHTLLKGKFDFFINSFSNCFSFYSDLKSTMFARDVQCHHLVFIIQPRMMYLVETVTERPKNVFNLM